MNRTAEPKSERVPQQTNQPKKNRTIAKNKRNKSGRQRRHDKIEDKHITHRHQTHTHTMQKISNEKCIEPKRSNNPPESSRMCPRAHCKLMAISPPSTPFAPCAHIPPVLPKTIDYFLFAWPELKRNHDGSVCRVSAKRISNMHACAMRLLALYHQNHHQTHAHTMTQKI